ncbi:MAG: hypothetical protein ACU837_06125 [Gammaproteobacteria bacterium]
MRVKGMNTYVACLLVWACAFSAIGSESEEARKSCPGSFTQLNQWPVVLIPKRVLLIPLLSKNRDANENEHWAEQPAALLADFYRRRFQAKVVLLHNVHTWDDYYFEVERLVARQTETFDRIILIGHGGFDGPVLKKTEILKSLTVNGSEGIVAYATETQPGKQQIFSLTYDISGNKSFSAYIAEHWCDLAQMDADAAYQRLYDLKKRLLPIDGACYDRYCAALQSALLTDETDRTVRLEFCRDICRGPLFLLKTREEIRPERFLRFADSLNALSGKHGLVFFGECNPGTAAPESAAQGDDSPGFLVQSELLGGPYNTYVHMFAHVSRRVAAGPIGESSAEDVVRRIVTLESGDRQHYLCIAAPATP